MRSRLRWQPSSHCSSSLRRCSADGQLWTPRRGLTAVLSFPSEERVYVAVPALSTRPRRTSREFTGQPRIIARTAEGNSRRCRCGREVQGAHIELRQSDTATTGCVGRQGCRCRARVPLQGGCQPATQCVATPAAVGVRHLLTPARNAVGCKNGKQRMVKPKDWSAGPYGGWPSPA